jgi:uncharacterized protein YqgV (UPF0045/DUF77 family)
MNGLLTVELEKEIYKLLNYIRSIHEVIIDLPKQQSYITMDIKLAAEHDKALSEIFSIAEEALSKHGGI